MDQWFIVMQGHKIAIMTTRHMYRGTVKKTSRDSVVLSDAALVEVFGSLMSNTPERELKCPSDILIPFAHITSAFQQMWAEV